MYKEFLNKIKSKKLKVCVVGLGYVGLPLLVRLVKSNFNVFGYDKDQLKIKRLKNCISYISTIKNTQLEYFKKNSDRVFSNINKMKDIDVIIICLPTPLKKNNSPDMSYVHNFFNLFKSYMLDNKVIILESTVYPGACNDIIKKFKLSEKLSQKKLSFIYSPEREDPGNYSFSYKHTPKIVSGYNQVSLNIGNIIYSKFVRKIAIAKSIKIAETSKLLENIFRSVNIGMINEFKMICDRLGINIYDVIDIASTKNFGFMKFLPGPGLGGHCIPIDPYYLSWASKKIGYDPKFIKLSGKINKEVTNWIIGKILKFFKIKKIPYKNKKIIIIGVAYKKNVDDDRETPAYYIMEKLIQKKIKIDFHDPYIKSIKEGRKYKKFKNMKSKPLTQNTFKNSIATIIVTDHDKINYNKILKFSRFIFDTRGVYKSKNDSKIITL